MKYAFISWRRITQTDTDSDKIERVYKKIRREQPNAICRWVDRAREVREFAPDKIFLEPPPEYFWYPDGVMEYPCEKDFLENFNVEKDFEEE